MRSLVNRHQKLGGGAPEIGPRFLPKSLLKRRCSKTLIMALFYVHMGPKKGRFLTSCPSLPSLKPIGYTCTTELKIKNIWTQCISVLNAPQFKKKRLFPSTH